MFGPSALLFAVRSLHGAWPVLLSRVARGFPQPSPLHAAGAACSRTWDRDWLMACSQRVWGIVVSEGGACTSWLSGGHVSPRLAFPVFLSGPGLSRGNLSSRLLRRRTGASRGAIMEHANSVAECFRHSAVVFGAALPHHSPGERRGCEGSPQSCIAPSSAPRPGLEAPVAVPAPARPPLGALPRPPGWSVLLFSHAVPSPARWARVRAPAWRHFCRLPWPA